MSGFEVYRLDTSNRYHSGRERALWEASEAHVRAGWRLLFRYLGAKCDRFEFNCFRGDRHALPKPGNWIDASVSTATGLDLLRPFATAERVNPDPKRSMYWQVVGRLAPEALAVITDSPFARHMGGVAPWFDIGLRGPETMRVHSHDWGASPLAYVTETELGEIGQALAEISPDLALLHEPALTRHWPIIWAALRVG